MAHDMLHTISIAMCCTRFAHNCALTTVVDMLETVHGAVRRW